MFSSLQQTNNSTGVFLTLVKCLCIKAEQLFWAPSPTPSCSSSINTGVILSGKASIRFLDIVRAGAMNYLPVHVFVKTFFSPVIFYLSIFSFPSCQPQGRILTYPNCNVTLKDYFPNSLSLTVGRFQQQERAALQCASLGHYCHCGTWGCRIRRSLSADSQLKSLSLWQHFAEKGSTITTVLYEGVWGDWC